MIASSTLARSLVWRTQKLLCANRKYWSEFAFAFAALAEQRDALRGYSAYASAHPESLILSGVVAALPAMVEAIQVDLD